MLAIPALVALVYFFHSSTIQLDAGRPPLSPGLFAFLILLTSAFLVQNEISKEGSVYRREHRTNSLLFPYVLSKVWLVAIWAIYQGVVWTIAHSLREMGLALTAGVQVLLPTAIILTLVSFVGGILGLIVSAFSRTSMTTGWVLLLTIPLLLFLFDPLSQWWKLASSSLFLIALLMGIQQRAAGVRK